MDMNEVSRFEQKVGTLRLSEAMRIGAKIRPQCERHSFINGMSCALGAAAEAAGMPYEERQTTTVNVMRFLRNIYPSAPFADIYLKNDTHGWTREQIADWLEADGL